LIHLVYQYFYSVSMIFMILLILFLFFLNHPATTVFYSLSLHDALPIFFSITLLGKLFSRRVAEPVIQPLGSYTGIFTGLIIFSLDRKSTRLNSSHVSISYAVFCLKIIEYYLISVILNFIYLILRFMHLS